MHCRVVHKTTFVEFQWASSSDAHSPLIRPKAPYELELVFVKFLGFMGVIGTNILC